jgi:hypothetical protein
MGALNEETTDLFFFFWLDDDRATKDRAVPQRSVLSTHPADASFASLRSGRVTRQKSYQQQKSTVYSIQYSGVCPSPSLGIARIGSIIGGLAAHLEDDQPKKEEKGRSRVRAYG